MEVLVGSTFSIEVSSPSAATAYVVANSSQENNSSPCIFLKEDEIVASGGLIRAPEDESSDSSSSIGAPDDSDEEEEEGEEVESVVLFETALNSLDSLEESLPIKKGLSNHINGKSKSFANLSDVLMSSSSVTVKDLEKPENPFNKRRRLLMANKWSRKSSFYSWSNPKSMPLLTLNEDDEQQQNQQDGDDEDDEEAEVSQGSPSSSSPEHELLRNQRSFSKLKEKKFKKSFKSHSCFSLTDLQHEEFE